MTRVKEEEYEGINDDKIVLINKEIENVKDEMRECNIEDFHYYESELRRLRGKKVSMLV